MKRSAREVAAAAVSLALLGFHSEARAHGCSSASAWEGISSNILEQSCFTGCHGSSGNGGMSVSYDTDDGWYAALVNRAPANTAAGGFGKLRVDPKRHIASEGSVSVVDLAVLVEKKTSGDEVNAALKAASEGALKNILA